MSGVRVAVGMLVALSALIGLPERVAAQNLQFTRIGAIPGPADLVRVDAGRAYVSAAKTFTIFDISTPEMPKRLGSHTFPEKIWGYKIVGPNVYVAADFYGFAILDVSNPASPSLRGMLKTPGQAKSVAIYGTKALVADHMSGVDYLDISEPAHPVKLGSFFVDGYARDVVAAGPVAYAIDAPTGLYVLDLNKQDPLEALSTVQSASTPSFIELSDAESPSRLACIIGAGSLQIFDVTNPAAPTKVATFKTPGRPVRAALKGSLAYVADGPEGLQVVDLSVPSAPRVVGSFKTPAPARDVAVNNGLIFVVVGARDAPGEVLVLRQSQN